MCVCKLQSLISIWPPKKVLFADSVICVCLELYFYSLTHLNPQEVVNHQRYEGLKWVVVYLWFWKFPHICCKEQTWRGKGRNCEETCPQNIDKLKMVMEPKRAWRGPPFSCFNLAEISSRATTRASSITWCQLTLFSIKLKWVNSQISVNSLWGGVSSIYEWVIPRLFFRLNIDFTKQNIQLFFLYLDLRFVPKMI